MDIDLVKHREDMGFRLIERYEVNEGGRIRGEVVKLMHSRKAFTKCKVASGALSLSRSCTDKTCSKEEIAYSLLHDDDVKLAPPSCAIMILEGKSL